VIPLTLFRNRTLTLSVVASAGVGVVMFGAAVFLAQYMQLARGLSPTASGLYTAPVVIGSLAASTITGQLVSRTGRYKSYLVGGAAVLVVGMGLMATIDQSTSFWLLSPYIALIGIGMGSCMQNLVLATQNTVDVRQMGSATATVTFFRSLGGAAGVAALGAVLAHRVQDGITTGLDSLGVALPAGQGSGAVPDIGALPLPSAGWSSAPTPTASPTCSSRPSRSRWSPWSRSACCGRCRSGRRRACSSAPRSRPTSPWATRPAPACRRSPAHPGVATGCHRP